MITRDLTLPEIKAFLKSGALMGLGLENCLVALGELRRSAKPSGRSVEFYVPDFFLEDERPWLTFAEVVVAKRDRLVGQLSEIANQPHLDLRWRDPEFSEFQKKFESVQQAIAKNEIQKAVPVTFSHATGTLTAAMRANMIAHLLREAKKPTPYGFWTPEEGILGATPEILFSYDKREGALETMALAGTRASALEAHASLVNDPKEMFEHDLVIKGLKEKLGSFGEPQVSPTYVWDLGVISHLRTDISVEFANPPASENFFSEMCMLLHPTAALGVAPNGADWRFLKKCDGTQKRFRFGAPFGLLNPAGKSVVLVAIRNIQWLEDQLILGAGCGIVEQSRLENEWHELEMKRRSVRAMLGI